MTLNKVFLLLLSFGSISGLPASLVTQLKQQSGAVFLPGSQDYEERRKVINAACTARPAVIVVPNTPEDVSLILKAATGAGIPISVRSGGHSYICSSIKEGSVQIDMRSFNRIDLYKTSVSPTGLAAVLGTGNQWGAVLDKIPTSQFNYPHGQCRSVGVGGYLLGGGVNWLGTYNKLGYGAEYVLAMRAVLADGRIVDVEPTKTKVLSPTPALIPHTDSNNLFFALRGAGSSYAVVTEFVYMIDPKPEALPAVILAWIDNKQDLEAVQRAAQSSDDYSITISNEFAKDFWKTATVAAVYEVLPNIMNLLRNFGRIQGKNSYPVFLTVTDIRPNAGVKTDVAETVKYLKSQGVRLVFQTDQLHRAFHVFAEYLYDTNILEFEQVTPGKYNLASFNFGSLANHDSFQDAFFNNPSFGLKRADFMEFTNHKCDYCFWMIHYRNRHAQGASHSTGPISTNVAASQPNTLDTNIVCMFKDKSSSCPTLVNDIKKDVESSLAASGSSYSKYINFPSCSEADWAERYWGSNLPRLEAIKQYWDPSNVFNHCQSVGSSTASGQECCPFSTPSSPSAPSPPPPPPSTTSCTTTSGKPCKFPFTNHGVSHSSCTYQGGFSTPWCSTLTNNGNHVPGNYGDCDTNKCPVEGEVADSVCKTVSGPQAGSPCKFPFKYNGRSHFKCIKTGNEPYWCSTRTNWQGNHMQGYWGDCHSSCPRE